MRQKSLSLLIVTCYTRGDAILMRGHYCRGALRDAGALRAKALAEDMKAPPGLLMPLRGLERGCAVQE